MEPFEANGHWTVDTYSKFCCSELIFLLFYTHKIELYYCSIGNFNRCTQGFQKPIIRTLSKCSSKNSCIIQYYFKFNDRKILVCNVCPKYHASNNSLCTLVTQIDLYFMIKHILKIKHIANNREKGLSEGKTGFIEAGRWSVTYNTHCL